MDRPKRRSLDIPAPEIVMRENESKFISYIFSVMAATCSEIVTYPFDLIKTRLQIQGEKALKSNKQQPYRGMVKTTLSLISEEGFFKLWQGLTPMIYRHSIYSGLRLITYEHLREMILSGKEEKYLPFWQSVLVGGGAGAFAQFFASPADLVKVRVQMEGRLRLMGYPPRIKGVNDAFIRVYKENGFFGLWKGAVPNITRAALVNVGDLATYDAAKQFTVEKIGLQDNWITHFIASTIAGFVAAVLSTPADVIKSRVMNQPMDENGNGLHYRGTFHCLQKSIHDEGFFALYKGFFPSWIRLGPWAIVFWMSYEQFRILFGYHGF